MCIPEGDLINDSLRLAEEHLENITYLLRGLPEYWSEDFLKQIQNAEESPMVPHNTQYTNWKIP